ncbi:glycosyl transferase [Spirochaetia bacterium]|nr:glycosyl transferase [Spirochaetia bacterium]
MYRIKKLLLSSLLTREIFFFIFQKKVYKRCIDKKIIKLLDGKRCLSGKKIDNFIVSLTSFPDRIHEIKYTIYSLLTQSVLPEKIILWLADSQFPNKESDLPDSLLAFKKNGLEIRWCEDIKSYKKLIPSLREFPDYYILTADDDIYYPKRWLEKTWWEHKVYPKEVICHVANKIQYNDDKNVLPYKEWKRCIKPSAPSVLNFPVGAGGIFYHKSLLFPDIAREDLFSSLAPYADDIWFYFMVVLQKTLIRIVRNPCNKMKYVNPNREYNLVNQYKLTTINIDNDQNQVQIQNILDYYHVDLAFLISKVETGKK